MTEDIEQLIADENEEELSGYRISGKKEAAWAVQKLKFYQGQKSENDEVAADRIAEIKAWQEKENARLQRTISFFEGALTLWHKDQVTADPNDEKAWKKDEFTRISLPDGVLRATRSSRVNIQDSEAFEAWAKAHQPDWLRTRYEPIKAAIKEAGGIDPETGEIAPGVEVVKNDVTWKVEVQ